MLQTVERRLGPRRAHLLILVLLAAVALGIRLYGAGESPFWADEGRYVAAAAEMVRDGTLIQRFPTTDAVMSGQPPVFFYLLATLHVLPVAMTELAARSPSILLGALTVVLIGVLATRLWDRRTGLVAALLLAVETNHVIYSREAIPNAAGIFLLTATATLAVLAVEEQRRDAVVATAATACLAIATHLVSIVLLVLAPVLAGLQRLRGRDLPMPRIWTAGVAVVAIFNGLLFIALNARMVPETGAIPPLGGGAVATAMDGIGVVASTVQLVVSTPLAAYGEAMTGIAGFYVSPSFLYIPAVLLLMPLAVGVRRYRAGEAQDTGTVALYTWLLVTFLLLTIPVHAVLSAQGLPIVRGHPFLIPPLILLMARGTTLLIDRWPPGGVLVAALVLAYLVNLPPVLAGTTITVPGTDAADDLRSPAALAGHLTAPTDSLVCSGPSYRPPFCLDRHPVGYDDTVDWRAATRAATMDAPSGTTFYVSMAGPFLHYTDHPGTVRGLVCNVDHRSCDLTRALFGDGPVAVVTDDERMSWQLTAYERRLLDRCDRETHGGLAVFRCDAGQT